MRVEIDVVRKRDSMAVDGNWFPDLKIRRVTYYPDGTYFRHEYLSFLTGKWVAKDATGIPRQCIYDDKLRAIMNAGEKEQRPRTVVATIIDGEHRYSGPIPRDNLEVPTAFDAERGGDKVMNSARISVDDAENADVSVYLTGDWANELEQYGGRRDGDGLLLCLVRGSLSLIHI